MTRADLIVTPLEAGWEIACSPPGDWSDPDAAAHGAWHPAAVPGTAAAALEALGLWSREAPTPLHDQDVWYRTILRQVGPALLRFEGLATIAEVWLDGVLRLRTTSMFETYEVAVDLTGANRLAIAFRSLRAHLATLKGSRARWRTRMVEDARLRFVRTTLLGHAPGWCPPFHVVGPWRPVTLVQAAAPPHPGAGPAGLLLGAEASGRTVLEATVEGSVGVLRIAVAVDGLAPDDIPRLHCGAVHTDLARDATGRWAGTLRIPDVALWWPHTHGTPHLYPVSVQTPCGVIDLGRTGFRTLVIDRGPDGNGFTLTVNDVRVFCRGACWTPADLVTLDGTPERIRAALAQVVSVHANMLRVGGTMMYEAPAFYETCDALGILVWQDCMFANFDYPTDPAFLDTVRQEVGVFLDRTQASPSLAVLAGGSEVLQQAAMMGLPERLRVHALFDAVLPALVAERRPGLAYVPGSPSGGSLPFVAEAGPSHYYGVGAYGLPLEDARRANVRFASECLTFANVPEDVTLRDAGLDPVADPAHWAARVPRDNGAGWDFEDTRHHYMTRLYRVDGAALRAADPQRYLDLSRAVTAEVTERTFDEWRRPGSVTAGGLVWFWKDFWAGAGWGVVDSAGRPKSNAHAMRRAFAPLRLSITDEGVNGLAVHCVNDTATPIMGEIVLTCLRDGALRVMEGRAPVTVPARSGITLPAFTLFGAFFDAGYVYKFGPPTHDTVGAVLIDGDAVLAEAVFALDHARGAIHAVAPRVVLERDADGWVLTLEAERALQGVVVDAGDLVPDDNWFALMPGRRKVVRLSAMAGTGPGARPDGEVRAINLAGAVRFVQTC